MAWKRISRHRAFQEGVSLLRAKSRDNVGTASAAGWPPDRPGRADAVCGLVANLGEKEMATHSSILTWRTPWTEEPGGLPSMGSHRVGCDRSDLAAAAANFYNLKTKSFLEGWH